MAFTIEVLELEDGTGFQLYDLTDWVAPFDSTKVTSLTLTVEHGGITYTYGPTDLRTDMSLGPTYVNLCGTALNSYFVVLPSKLLSGTTPLNTTYFPDGFYEITLYCTYTGLGAIEDTSRQGFLAETYMMASQLPLQIDPDNFDYEENRLQFLCIAMLRSATWAANLGRQTEFETLTTKINDFLDARSINEIWST
jgi:hypothetical protein